MTSAGSTTGRNRVGWGPSGWQPVAVQTHRPLAGLLVIDECLSAEDLDLLAGVIDSVEFEPQDLGRGGIAVRFRGASDDSRIPTLLWDRLRPVLPPVATFFGPSGHRPNLEPPLESWRAVGCNPRSRLYRYGPGASFSPHQDEPWRPYALTRSLLTVLVYANTAECDGGETVVEGEVVTAVPGRVVIFDHSLRHEGKSVLSGTKLVIRSDIIASAAAH